MGYNKGELRSGAKPKPKNQDIKCPECGRVYVTSDPINVAKCPDCGHEIMGPN